MTKVTVTRAEPSATPPITSVTITVSLPEAQVIRDLLGALRATTKPIDTYPLYRALASAAPELDECKTQFHITRGD